MTRYLLGTLAATAVLYILANIVYAPARPPIWLCIGLGGLTGLAGGVLERWSK